jgi:hypothetical protein
MATTIDTGQTRTKTRADRWQLEHGQSNIEFRIKHLWFSQALEAASATSRAR